MARNYLPQAEYQALKEEFPSIFDAANVEHLKGSV